MSKRESTARGQSNLLSVRADGIPNLLKKKCGWVAWRERQKPSGKTDKIPIDPKSGKSANALDEANQLSYEDAMASYRKGRCDGIGIVLTGHPVTQAPDGRNLYLVAVDLDDVVENTLHAKSAYMALRGAYVETSPSGKGLHIFALCDTPLTSRNAGEGREIYSGGRFMTVTGHEAHGDIIDATDALKGLQKDWLGQTKPGNNVTSLFDFWQGRPDIPPEAKKRMMATSQRLTGHHSDRPEDDHSVREIREALSFIPADDYQTWRDMIWAVASLGWNCGEELLVEWSKGSSGYWDTPDDLCETEEQLRKLYASYDATKGLTVASLFHRAKEHGFDPKSPTQSVEGRSGEAITIAMMGKAPVSELLDDQRLISKRGKAPIGNHANIMAVVRMSDEWDGALAYDEFADEVMLLQPMRGSKAPKSTFTPRPIADADFVRGLEWFNRNGFPSLAKQTLIDAMDAVAREALISPLRHHLEDIEHKINWSPKTHEARLPTLFQGYFGTTADKCVLGAHPKYLAAIGTKFMIAAVARALTPGCKVDTMLVLEGPQGAGKSTAVRILAGEEWFSDHLPQMGTKDASDHVKGKWIIEVGELAAMNKSDVESMKGFISRREEKYRPVYMRKEVTYPRRCVFVGTTNSDTYLRDETGNRRFWPVKVGKKIDLLALKRDRELLWAEAIYYFRKGEMWHLTGKEAKHAATAQNDRVAEDIWHSKLTTELEGRTEVSISEAADKLCLDTTRQTRVEQNRIVAVFRALGFERDGKFTSGNYRNSARYARRAED